MSDPLHELCSSHIDFHPTLKKTAHCKLSPRYCGSNERAKCVGNVPDKKRKENKGLSKSIEGFEDVMSSSVGQVETCRGGGDLKLIAVSISQ